MLPHLVYDLLEALLELSAILRACHEAGKVEGEDPLAAQGLRHLLVDDPLGETLDDGGLTHTGVADEHWVVLGAKGEYLYGGLDLLRAPDDGIELALTGHPGEVAAVLVERGCGTRRLARLSAVVHPAHDRPAQPGVREPEARK